MAHRGRPPRFLRLSPINAGQQAEFLAIAAFAAAATALAWAFLPETKPERYLD